MVEIGGRPILWHIMKIYAAHGIERFRHLPRLQGLRDQGVLRQLLPAHVRRIVRPGQRRGGDLERSSDRAVARDAGRHRPGDDDRWPAEARAGRLAATRTSASPTATESPTSTSRRSIAFHRAQGALATVTAVQPPGPLRRAQRRRRPGARVRGEAAQAERRLGERRLLRAVAPAVGRYIDGDQTVFEQEPMGALARDGQLACYRPRWLLAGDGHCCATVTSSRRCGRSGDPPWKLWR